MKLLFTIAALCIATCFMAQTKAETEIVQTDNPPPEILAAYPGGNGALIKYIKENVINKVALTNDEAAIFRKVFASFVINENGTTSNIQILKTSNVPRVDSLLILAIKNMPAWVPAATNGKPVKQNYVLPLQMCLQ